MAENKKKVIVYADWVDKFEALEDAEAGRLIKHFFRYINDFNPEYPDRVTELCFIDIKKTLQRDLVVWEKRAEKSRENGKSGGRPLNPKKPKETKQVISKPKEPVNVNVNVNVKDNVNVNVNKKEYAQKHALLAYIESEGFVRVQKMKEPLTEIQCEKLVAKFEKKVIAEVLLSMENFAPLHKRYVSAYKTILNWIKTRENGKSGIEKPKGFDTHKVDGLIDAYLELKRKDGA